LCIVVISCYILTGTILVLSWKSEMAELNAGQVKVLQYNGKDKLYNCGDNLYINVREKSKTWVWRGTIDGKRLKKTIGDYSRFTLKAAREISYKMKHEKPKQRKYTFSELADDYLAETDYKQIERLTERVTYLKTIFGNKDINKITKLEIVEFVRKYRKRSPSMANHHRIHIGQIFQHGISLGWIENNPAQGIPRSASGYKPKRKDRTLSDKEIQWLFTQENPNAHIMRFQLLTGLRVTEAINGTVDGDKYRVIAKGGRDHWIHLTDFAREQLPLPIGKKQQAVSEWCRRQHITFRSHDCRRTHATLANGNGVEPFIVERVLSHILPGMMAVYNHAEYEKQRIECAETIERVIKDIIHDSNSGKASK